jgi:hypothetical protein
MVKKIDVNDKIRNVFCEKCFEWIPVTQVRFIEHYRKNKPVICKGNNKHE